MKILRTNSENLPFQNLVAELDKDLAIRDGDEHHFYAQFNKIDSIKFAIVAFENELPIGCGAIKEFSNDTMEIKRMFVLPNFRSQGVATLILKELEAWASELEYVKCILETGEKQPEAIQLYLKNGYEIIPNYGQYEAIENSVCFLKNI